MYLPRNFRPALPGGGEFFTGAPPLYPVSCRFIHSLRLGYLLFSWQIKYLYIILKEIPNMQVMLSFY
jgi:hypothetical protein